MSPLRGRVAYWLRQLKPDCGENTLAEVIATMKTYGDGDCLCLKVMDGLDYQGFFDSTLPVNSVADIIAVRDLCHSLGVAFCPVVVPRGLAGEAEAHGAVAAAIGCLMTDIEDGPGFWDHYAITGVPLYVGALRQSAPNAYLIHQPDPRDTQVSGYAAGFNAVCAQHYVGWTSEGVNWTDVSLEVRRYQRLLGLYPETYVTLYGKDRIDLAVTFWEQVMHTTGGFCVFSLGAMDGAELNYFRDNAPRPFRLPEPIDGPPAPTPVPAPVDDRIDRALALARQAVAVLEEAPPAPAPPLASWQEPLTAYTVTQEFGVPELGVGTPHTGIDLAAPEGTPILSATAGVVHAVLDQGDEHYGKSVWVNIDGLDIIYGHMSRQDVAMGQTVSPGDRLGLVGQSGFATGPHLHFEVRRDDRPVNPREFLAL